MSIDPEALAKSIERLQGTGLADNGLVKALRLVVDETERLFSVDGAGLMLLAADDQLRYVAASDEPGRVLEQIQEEVGEGPCLAAFDTGEPSATSNALTDQRWPAFGRLVAEHGIHAVLGVPVELQGGPIGTLNVYAVRPHEWDPSEQAKGILMERHGIDARTAFERLRRHARSRQERLTDLARRMIDDVSPPPV